MLYKIYLYLIKYQQFYTVQIHKQCWICAECTPDHIVSATLFSGGSGKSIFNMCHTQLYDCYWSRCGFNKNQAVQKSISWKGIQINKSYKVIDVRHLHKFWLVFLVCIVCESVLVLHIALHWKKQLSCWGSFQTFESALQKWKYLTLSAKWYMSYTYYCCEL